MASTVAGAAVEVSGAATAPARSAPRNASAVLTALLAAMAVCLQVYWFALLWRGRRLKNGII